jgi:hypothetical protein
MNFGCRMGHGQSCANAALDSSVGNAAEIRRGALDGANLVSLSPEQTRIFDATIGYLEESARSELAAGMAIARRRDAKNSAELESRIIELQRQRGESQRQLDESQRQLDESQRQLDESQRQLDESQRQLDELQRQLEGLRNAYFVNIRRNSRRRDFLRRLLILSSARKWWDRRRLGQQQRFIARTGLFDEAWYLRRHPEVAAEGRDPILHYLEIGASLGCDPREDFHTTAFCAENPKASLKGMNPFIFYLTAGNAVQVDRKPRIS